MKMSVMRPGSDLHCGAAISGNDKQRSQDKSQEHRTQNWLDELVCLGCDKTWHYLRSAIMQLPCEITEKSH